MQLPTGSLKFEEHSQFSAASVGLNGEQEMPSPPISAAPKVLANSR